MSFRRFLGLSLSEPVPDHSTLRRFREQLAKSELAERFCPDYGADREVWLRLEARHNDRRFADPFGGPSATRCTGDGPGQSHHSAPCLRQPMSELLQLREWREAKSLCVRVKS
ncbi:transposase [Bradyrhizobium brasilense]|uniref:transposase n=1 Tax=Bradyrhizobium brasilense TaxID=1419277 RepID=UPI003D310230